MRIQATVNNTTRVYEDTDAVFGLLRMTKKDIGKASRCYTRIKKGETMKLRYMGSSIYLRKIGD